MQELSLNEQLEINGGDWFETYWGFMLTSAFIAGFTATPVFLVVAGMAGAALITTEYLTSN